MAFLALHSTNWETKVGMAEREGVNFGNLDPVQDSFYYLASRTKRFQRKRLSINAVRLVAAS